MIKLAASTGNYIRDFNVVLIVHDFMPQAHLSINKKALVPEYS